MRTPLWVVGAVIGVVVQGMSAGRYQPPPDYPEDQREFERIASLLHVVPGASVADVGAGDGNWTVRLSRQVGPSGHVFATEIREPLLKILESSAAAREQGNVTAVRGTQTDTGLAENCCDAI